MKYRAGDIVSVQGTVKFNTDADDKTVSVYFEKTGNSMWPPVENVMMVRQKIVIGDEISFSLNETAIRVGRVLAISNDHAWIDLGDGEYCTRLLSSIERLDE